MSEQDKQASTPDGDGDGTSRRMFMVGGAAAVGAAAIGRARSSGTITDDQARLLDKITAASAASATGAASLSDAAPLALAAVILSISRAWSSVIVPDERARPTAAAPRAAAAPPTMNVRLVVLSPSGAGACPAGLSCSLTLVTSCGPVTAVEPSVTRTRGRGLANDWPRDNTPMT